MTIPSQERVRPIVLTVSFRDVAESHLLPMSQYAADSRRAQILIQMVDGTDTIEAREHRHRTVIGVTALSSDQIIAALEGDEGIREHYKVYYIPVGSNPRQGADEVRLIYSPPDNTPL